MGVILLVVLLLFGCSACQTGGEKIVLDYSAAGRAAHKAPASDRRNRPEHVYNYPHSVPEDYVYRTERILPGRRNPLLLGLPIAGKGEAESSAAGQDGEAGVVLRQQVRQMLAGLFSSGRSPLDEDLTVTVSTFVNLNSLYTTSAFGRLLAEEGMLFLQNQGLAVVEVRKPPAILIREQFGEYGLSRDMAELPYIHNADAMLVGTYSVAADQVFVHCKLVRNQDGEVLAGAATTLPADSLVTALLADEKTPTTRPLQQVTISAGGEEGAL